MYTYYRKDDVNHIKITSTVPRQRIVLKVKDNNIYSGNIKVVLKENDVELHHHVQSKPINLTSNKKEIGIDKGYRTLIDTSTGNLYGERLN